MCTGETTNRATNQEETYSRRVRPPEGDVLLEGNGPLCAGTVGRAWRKHIERPARIISQARWST